MAAIMSNALHKTINTFTAKQSCIYVLRNMADVLHGYLWSENSICYTQQILLNENATSINEALVRTYFTGSHYQQTYSAMQLSNAYLFFCF